MYLVIYSQMGKEITTVDTINKLPGTKDASTERTQYLNNNKTEAKL